jgi:hypothetical protein
MSGSASRACAVPLIVRFTTCGLLFFAAKLAGSLFEDILRDRQRRKRVGPTDIEREVCDDLSCLRLRQAIIHRAVQVIGDLRDLTGSN